MAENKDYNPKTFESLTYPLDMSANNFYPEAICFTINKRNGLQLQDVADATRALYATGKDDDVKTASSNFVNDINSKRIRGKKTSRELLGSIYMNMPSDISYSEEANWGGTEMGTLGKGISDFISGKDDPIAMAAGAGVGSIGNLVGAGLGTALGSVAGKLGLGAILGAIGGVQIQKGIDHGLGVSKNPYMEMMFSGVGFRSFNFAFTMRPISEDEIDEVSKIIKMFRLHSRPSWVNHGISKSYMEYPQEFEIKFLTQRYGGSQHDLQLQENVSLPKIKPCVLSSITTNYTPQGLWTAFSSGAAVAVQMTLAFQETELLMAEDIADDADFERKTLPSQAPADGSRNSLGQQTGGGARQGFAP
jgi:hypothetical protein